jgi:cell division protein FtsB
MADQTDTVKNNPTGTDDDSGSSAGSSGEAKDTANASITKPRSGAVTADEKKRFLAEIVALRGLSKASDAIAKSIAEVGRGGILIVNELDFVTEEIIYLNICQKLDSLLMLSKEAEKRCQEFAEAQPDDKVPKRELVKGTSSKLATAIAPAALGTITAGATAISGLLGAVGDIIGFFRSDYEFKGQTLTPEDLYIQALVADKLRNDGRDVYLIDFHALKESRLISDLNELFRRKLTMLTCAESIKSKYIDEQTELATALEAHAASLRVKLVENLINEDEQVIATLRQEIDQKTCDVMTYQKNRVPDSQITALETYLASLRAKLADELLKDNLGSKDALNLEIQKIVQQLAENEKASADKKLTEAEVKALTDQLKLYQTKLVEMVVNAGYNPKEALTQEIEHVNELLKDIQNGRVPASQISALETYVASLNVKLVDCLATNDADVKARLEGEISRTACQIEAIRKAMSGAQGIISNCTKVSDAIDGFITAITTVPSSGNYPPYVVACVREYFAGERIKFILKLKLITSGADFIIEKPPFYSRDVHTSYLGGGVVSFILAEKEGKIVASGTVGDVIGLNHRIGEKPKLIEWTKDALAWGLG